MLNRIRLDINIIKMQFEYSDMNTVLDIDYPDSNMDRSESHLNRFNLEYGQKNILTIYTYNSSTLFILKYKVLKHSGQVVRLQLLM